MCIWSYIELSIRFLWFTELQQPHSSDLIGQNTRLPLRVKKNNKKNITLMCCKIKTTPNVCQTLGMYNVNCLGHKLSFGHYFLCCYELVLYWCISHLASCVNNVRGYINNDVLLLVSGCMTYSQSIWCCIMKPAFYIQLHRGLEMYNCCLF